MDKTIPKDWQFVKLGDISSLEYGKGLSQLQRERGEFPVYGSNGIVGYHSEYLVKGPGIVVGRKGTIGAVSWVAKNFWPIDTTYYIKLVSENIDLKWLYYKLISLKLSKLNMATGIPGLNRELAYGMEVPLPPLTEQQKIAEVLSTVDEAIQKVVEAIENTQRLKQGLMQELLTKGIGHKEFKESEFGRIPKEWEVLKIKDIGGVFTGKTPPTSNKKLWNGDVPFITPGDIKDSKYVYKTERYVTLEGAKTIGIVSKDTILVVCIGSTIGKIGIAYQDSITNQQINSIVCKKDMNPHYFYYALTFKSNLIRSYSGVAAVPIIKKSLFENFRLPLSKDTKEQEKIAEILSSVHQKLELEQKRKSILEKIKSGLMEDLLTGKRRIISDGK